MNLEDRCRYLDHKGRRVLLIDMVGMRGGTDDVRETLATARKMIASLPVERKLLTIVDVSNTIASADSVQDFTDLARHNTPWVLASAVVGVPMTMRLLLRILTSVTGRKIAAFKTRGEALDWVTAQKEPPQVVPEHLLEEPQA